MYNVPVFTVVVINQNVLDMVEWKKVFSYKLNII